MAKGFQGFSSAESHIAAVKDYIAVIHIIWIIKLLYIYLMLGRDEASFIDLSLP